MTFDLPTRAWALLLIMLVISPGMLQAAPPEGYDFLSVDDALERARAENKPMLLYFGRYGCTTCGKMDAEVFTDEGLKKRYSADLVLAYVDTESSHRIRLANGERTTEMQFAARSRILGTPTFVFFSPELKPLFRKEGFQTAAQMQNYREFIVGGHYRDMALGEYLASQ